MEDNEQQGLVPSKMPPAAEVRIRRGFIGEITIHQVADDELETLARGYPDSAYLNYSIFLLSVAVSFLITLLTTQVTGRVFNVFAFIVILGFLLGVWFLILWFKNRRSTSELVQKIRKRLPPEGIQEEWTVINVSHRKDE